MKRLMLTLWLALSVFAYSEEEVPFDEMFDEAQKLVEELAKDLSEEDYGEEYGKEILASEKATYAATLAVLKTVRTGEDRTLKAKILTVEFGWAINECYWELEASDGKIQRMATRARLNKYKGYLKKLEELTKSP